MKTLEISEERAALLADRARFEEEKKLWEMEFRERSASIEQRINTMLKRKLDAQIDAGYDVDHCYKCGCFIVDTFCNWLTESGNRVPMCEECYRGAVRASQQKRARLAISPELRQQVWEKRNTDTAHPDVGKCFCCGFATTRNDFECGFVKSFSDGGTTKLANLEPICHTCNRNCWTKGLIDYGMSPWEPH